MDKNDYYKNLPKKRMGAGVLLFNKKKELLIIKPSYKDYWSIPGGVIEENESPIKAVIREAKEEIGIDIKKCKFLILNYYSKNNKIKRDENLQFMFYGGVLDKNDLNKIKVDGKEIIEYKFVKIKQAAALFNKRLGRRLPVCLKAIKNNKPVYLENG